MRAIQISVVGSGSEWEAQAEQVGRLLAERSCTVVTGGGAEVMAAAARGAKQAGGRTIGILPGESPDEANEWIDFAVATGIGHARNLAVAASGDAVIAVGGSWGTLSELAFARQLGRPTVVLEGGVAVEGEGVLRAASPEEAVELALSALEARSAEA
ncbi:MAG TPA: TIGR00725 family protein [Gaiellaceae bacterium]